MPDRYWVGGTASWDGTAGTKWSATSGGAGGASVPTTADDVFFDASSTGTVTIAAGNTGAKSINCTGFAGTITGTAAITVAGSVTLVAAMTYTHSGTMTFTGTGTLTTAGKTFSSVTVDGVGITLTLGDALNINPRRISVTAGGFATANYNLTAAGFSSSNSNTRTITLGSSTITLSASDPLSLSTPNNLTFNSDTSQINLTNAFASIASSLTYYNVNIGGSFGAAITIVGANTFNNLTLTANTTGLSQLLLTANQTVNGTFTCAGSSAIARGFVRSDTLGTTRTITAAAISANDCDFRDITLAGAAAGASPTRAGDCGGNSGITFPAAKTVYWNLAGSQNWSANGWAPSSGGSPAVNEFPLAQDTAVFDQAGSAGTVTVQTFNVGAVDMSARTTVMTLSGSGAPTNYGDWAFGTGVTSSNTGTITFAGRSTSTITSNGITFGCPISISCVTGTVQLADALALNAARTLTLASGTFDAVSYNVTAGRHSYAVSGTTLKMGSGTFTASGTGNVWSVSGSITFYKDTANILLSDTSTTARTFQGGGLSYNKLTIGGATGASTLTILSSNQFTELASTKTVAHTVRFAANQGTIDTWSITGSAGNVVTVDSSAAGTRRTFNLTNVTSGIDYLAVRDIGVNQANRFYVGANSTDNGNNLNVIFTAAPGLDVIVPVTGVSSTGQVGTAEAFDVVDVPVTGVEASGQVGAVEAVGEAVVSAAGVEASGQVGGAIASESVAVAAIGVEAPGQVGQVIIPNVDVSVTGVAATGQVGATVAVGDATAAATGVASTGQVGDVVATGAATAAATGVEAVGEVGTADVTGDTNLTLVGVGATGEVGTAQGLPSIEVPVTGVTATAAVGSVAVTGSAVVIPFGVSAAALVGQVNVWGKIVPDPGSTWTEVDPSATNTWTEVSPTPGTTWNPVAA